MELAKFDFYKDKFENYKDIEPRTIGGIEMQGLPGDVDGNGKLSYNDALIVLRASIKLVDLTAEQKLLGDFDGNGILNYNDALAILRASIGL